jgi:endogenous inhibitor of DNA gyrase (YacG/DUF329 family)
MKCPICKKTVETSSPDAPFCSERCRIIDLGNWASGAYVIPVPLEEPGDGADEGDHAGDK